MNFKTTIALVLAAAATIPAFAETVAYRDAAPTPAAVTRADVHAELLRARAAGELDITEASLNYPFN